MDPPDYLAMLTQERNVPNLKKAQYTATATVVLSDNSKLDALVSFDEDPEDFDAITFTFHGPTGTTEVTSFVDNEIWNGPETVTYAANLGAGHYSCVVTGRSGDPSLVGSLFLYSSAAGHGAASSTVTETAETGTSRDTDFSITATI